jgi:hypothetical protein
VGCATLACGSLIRLGFLRVHDTLTSYKSCRISAFLFVGLEDSRAFIEPSLRAEQIMSDPEKTAAIATLQASNTSSSDIDSADGHKIDDEKIRERIQRRQELELQQSDPPPHAIVALFQRGEKHDLNAIATQPSVFDDPEQAEFFRPHPKYENLHRFDPKERWTWAEELVFIHQRLSKGQDADRTAAAYQQT